MNDRRYNMPTAVGERRGSAWADLFAFTATFLISVLATIVVAWMTHGFGRPILSGFMMLFGWARWLLDTFDPAAYLMPPWHPAPLTAFEWRVVWAIGVTWAIGLGVAFAGWLWITIACEPDAKRDVREMVDSARIAGEQDYRKSGFIAE